ncbi:hypothetical protein [Pluralibacter gergoviae]|uniref:hypothetical protein n=1 Tax=Pluralibacter gergoviae TaxID=61647 RepID=UPI000A48C29A|nr:hypothetical protein [Pluralibacter gergoviae]MCK1065038.1 hypothetical protein [Pluralibacter gergoviae]MDU4001404.1 hypothetical protein [Pluralibacter gergoviae]
MQLTNHQIYTLDMVYVHQGWHADCGIIMAGHEETIKSCDELQSHGLLIKREDGWFKITSLGIDIRKNELSRIK